MFQTTHTLDVLALCAVLHRFDRDLLATAGCPASQADELLGSDKVEATTGGYRLREDLAAEIVARLRAERPTDEVKLHQHAFAYFLAKLQQSIQTGRSFEDEDACLHHLDAIFILIGTGMDWQTILEYTLAVRAAEPRQVRHRQRLLVYEGYVAVRTQKYEDGEHILSQLLEEEIVDPDVHIKALKGLADAAFYRSQYDRSLELYQNLYTLAYEVGDLSYQGLALFGTGLVYHTLDHQEQALEYCKRSIECFRARNDRLREAHALYHVGLYSMYLGRWEDVQAYNTDAIQHFERLGLSSSLGLTYWLQGYTYHVFGDEPASEDAYLRALELAESPGRARPSLAMDVWLYLGFLYHTQEAWDAAIEHYERALALAIRLDSQHQIGAIYYRQGLVFQRQGRLTEAFAAYICAIDSIEALGGTTQGEDIKISLFGTTQQIYEAMVLLCLELGRPAEAFHYVERARSRAFLDSLAKKSPELSAALDRSVVTLADVQAQLPEGAVLLEYYTTGVLPLGEHMINKLPPENTRLREHLALPPNIVLFAITRDRFNVYRPALNPNSLRPPIGDRYPGRHLLHGRLPQHLYDRLIAPAAELLDACSVLYLVPHGPLHYVPFTALRSAAGEYLLHAGGPALAHAPSATILLRNCLGRPRERGSALLALGFNDPQGEQPLRYAEAEAQHIARMIDGDAWTGMQPKTQRLIASGRDIRWLHIAGHARFDPHDPLGSALALGSDDTLSARAIIRDLDLAADLVTLSSCTSGVSHVVPGDELLGLQRALLYAGVPTVVCTRWEARDLVALLIMDRFYTALLQGFSPAVALRDAQIAVRDLTSRDLAALLDRWRAEATDLAAALGAPVDALHDVQASTRELGDIDFNAILNSWRAEAADLAAALEQPAAVSPNMPEARPFADALLWAPFMLVGRA
jgi:CHAT domain-containing protein/tetratricopeptide (TPR) repeat protein